MPLRRFFFLYFAAGAVLMPSLALLFEQRGFGGIQLGMLTAAIPLTAAVVAPVWGAAADRTGRGTRLLQSAVVVAALAVPFMLNVDRFALALLAVVVFAIGVAPVLPFADAATLEHSVRVGSAYGHIRQWGGIGWGVTAPVIGVVVGVVGTQAIWIAYAGIMLLLAWDARRIEVPGGEYEGRSHHALAALWRVPGWPLLVTATALFGIGAGVISTYLFVRLDALGASAAVMGLALTVGTVSELVAFNVSDRLVARLGAMVVLLVGIVAVVGRLALLGTLASVGAVLVSQLLHGATFALPWTAAATQAARSSPPELRSSGQSLIGLAFAGVAPAIGALAGAVLLGRHGSGPMFLAIASALGAATLAVALAWWRSPSRRTGASAGTHPGPAAGEVGSAVSRGT